MLLREKVTEAIIGAAIEVPRQPGPGLLEEAYKKCLCREIELRGVAFERQVPCPLHYKGIKAECGYRIDLIVEEVVIVEFKSVEQLHPIHEAQLLTYLRITGKRVGLPINFNVEVLKHGIIRRAL